MYRSYLVKKRWPMAKELASSDKGEGKRRWVLHSSTFRGWDGEALTVVMRIKQIKHSPLSHLLSRLKHCTTYCTWMYKTYSKLKCKQKNKTKQNKTNKKRSTDLSVHKLYIITQQNPILFEKTTGNEVTPTMTESLGVQLLWCHMMSEDGNILR